MRNTYSAAALAFSLAIWLAAPASLQAQAKKDDARHSGAGRVHDKKTSFSMVPPKGWVLPDDKDKKPNAILQFTGPGEKDTPMLVINAVASDGTPIDKLGEAVKQGFARRFKQWKLLDESASTIDGKKAYAIAGQGIIPVGTASVEVRMLIYLIAGKDRIFIVTFTAVPKTFDSMRKQLEESAKSSLID